MSAEWFKPPWFKREKNGLSFTLKSKEGRSFNEAQRFVLDNMHKAQKIYPAAFPPGCIIRWWPIISDERQKAALEQAALG